MIRGDARALPIATGTVDCVVTSPPYLKQRVYGHDDREAGREETLADYVAMIVAVFDELRRVDVPGAVVAALMARGWRLRLPIVWDKGRQSPEDLRHIRRPRWQHEMIYLLTPWERIRRATETRPRWYPSQLAETGSVWHFASGGRGDAHLAPFPDELARRCILPTTLPGDVVLDPFAGSGTVARVARQLGRVGIGVELYAGRPDLITGTGRRAERRIDANEVAG